VAHDHTGDLDGVFEDAGLVAEVAVKGVAVAMKELLVLN
jgi:hypothetical protein